MQLSEPRRMSRLLSCWWNSWGELTSRWRSEVIGSNWGRDLETAENRFFVFLENGMTWKPLSDGFGFPSEFGVIFPLSIGIQSIVDLEKEALENKGIIYRMVFGWKGPIFRDPPIGLSDCFPPRIEETIRHFGSVESVAVVAVKQCLIAYVTPERMDHDELRVALQERFLVRRVCDVCRPYRGSKDLLI